MRNFPLDRGRGHFTAAGRMDLGCEMSRESVLWLRALAGGIGGLLLFAAVMIVAILMEDR